MCSISDSIEDTESFLLLCNAFPEHKRDLLAGVNDVLEVYGYSEAPDSNIFLLLLYGNKKLRLEANRLILNAAISSKQNALIEDYGYPYIEHPNLFCMCLF